MPAGAQQQAVSHGGSEGSSKKHTAATRRSMYQQWQGVCDSDGSVWWRRQGACGSGNWEHAAARSVQRQQDVCGGYREYMTVARTTQWPRRAEEQQG